MLLVWNFERHKAVQETSVAEVLCSEVYFKTLLTFTGLFSCKQSNTYGTVFCPYCKCQNPSQVCHCRLLLISPLRRTGCRCSTAADELFPSLVIKIVYRQNIFTQFKSIYDLDLEDNLKRKMYIYRVYFCLLWVSV